MRIITAKNNIPISFFIESLRVFEMGERARIEGDIDTLLRSGLSLRQLSLSGDFFEAGKMFEGYALNAAGDTNRAWVIFEQMSESRSLLRQAEALLALGEIEIQRMNLDRAMSLTQLALKRAQDSIPIIYNCLHNIALLKSLQGDFSGALDTLATALSLSKYVHPLCASESLNSAACNLNDLNKTDEASKLIDSILSSPIVRLNPRRSNSWFKTRDEIAAKKAEREWRRSRACVAGGKLLEFAPRLSDEYRKGAAIHRIKVVIYDRRRTASQLERGARAIEAVVR